MPHEVIREQNKARVIQVAAKQYAECGIEHTTFETIANAACLTSRSVQNYFGTREELMKATLVEMVAGLRTTLSEALDDPAFRTLDGLEQVLYIAEFVITAAKKNCKTVQAMTEIELSLTRKGSLPAKYFMSADSEVLHSILNAFNRGAQDGTLSSSLQDNKKEAMELACMIREKNRQVALSCAQKEYMYCNNPDELIAGFLQQLREKFSV